MSTALKTPTVVAVSQEGLRYGIAAILLGICFIGVTGFAHPEALHEAAHNTRHSLNFPCH